MKEPILKISLKEYEELKQFKDNAFKKNFLAISKGCFSNDYTNFHFYTDEEMNQKLFYEIELLKTENTDLKNQNACLKNHFENFKVKVNTFCNDEQRKFYIQLKKMNIFQFLIWKKTL
jgi:hypothetical protein